MKEAGVLDLWFSPVFQEEYKLPVINGNIGVYKDGIIKYGCAEFSERWWTTLWGGMNPFEDETNRKIVSVKLDSGVEISKENVEQIVKFIENN